MSTEIEKRSSCKDYYITEVRVIEVCLEWEDKDLHRVVIDCTKNNI